MKMTRRDMIAGLTGLGLGSAWAASAGLRIEGGRAFGSAWRVSLDAGADIGNLGATLRRIFFEVDAEMSPFRKTSDISAFNESRSTEWQAMPPALCQVAGLALHVARLTDGAFDPTVGPIVSRFGFGPIQGKHGPYDGIHVRKTGLRKTTEDLTLDLCGIAKGHALDRVIAEVSRQGIPNALVEVGGEVRSLGQHPDGRPWNVAISDPQSTAFRVHRIVNLRGKALATSGHSINGVVGPISASHIVDPRQAEPAATELLSVSVLADTGTQTEALATACCAAGPVEGVAIARRLNVSALFVTRGSNAPVETMTARFPQHVLI